MLNVAFILVPNHTQGTRRILFVRKFFLCHSLAESPYFKNLLLFLRTDLVAFSLTCNWLGSLYCSIINADDFNFTILLFCLRSLFVSLSNQSSSILLLLHLNDGVLVILFLFLRLRSRLILLLYLFINFIDFGSSRVI